MRRIAWTTMFILALGASVAACGGDDDDDGTTPDGGVGTPDGGAAAAPTCTEYCSRVTTNCSAANAQYTDAAECMAYCTAEAWEAGVDNATQSGDTLGCRQYHAGAAGMTGMPDVHCPHAGPTGGTVCGDVCQVYCDNLEKNCTGANVQYPDRASCETACAAMPVGTPADTMGDTAYCRVYHSGVPAYSDALTHCAHAGPTPTAQCI
jgi:hypothetical protein